MRFRRIEFVALALTFAFVCFMGGYFAGRRGTVNIVPVEPEQYSASEAPKTGAGTAANGAGAVESAVPATTPDISPSSAVQPGGNEIIVAPREDGRININTASRSELMDLPGIGTVLAGRIIDYRTQNGAFSNINDIRKVSGIGEKRFETIKDRITVGN